MRRMMLGALALAVLLAGAAPGQSPRETGAGQYLGDEYLDRPRGFSLRPPAGWWLEHDHPSFLVKFSERNYEAFIIVDEVKTPTPIKLDQEFLDLVLKQNQEVKKTMPGFQVIGNRPVRLNRASAYRTEAVFPAGPNKVLLNIYYVPAKTRVFMIMTICPEAAARRWDPLFEASTSTFTVFE